MASKKKTVSRTQVHPIQVVSCNRNYYRETHFYRCMVEVDRCEQKTLVRATSTLSAWNGSMAVCMSFSFHLLSHFLRQLRTVLVRLDFVRFLVSGPCTIRPAPGSVSLRYACDRKGITSTLTFAPPGLNPETVSRLPHRGRQVVLCCPEFVVFRFQFLPTPPPPPPPSPRTGLIY